LTNKNICDIISTEREVTSMNEFEIIKNVFARVRADLEIYEFEIIGSKSIFIPEGDGELELEFDGDGKLVDTTYWRD
jgi:hypothetical protein